MSFGPPEQDVFSQSCPYPFAQRFGAGVSEQDVSAGGLDRGVGEYPQGTAISGAIWDHAAGQVDDGLKETAAQERGA